MYSDQISVLKALRISGLLITIGVCISLSSTSHAQTINDTSLWNEDIEIDIALGALKGPVQQPVGFTGMDLRILPDSARYKQQPEGAQQDFRPPPKPKPETRPDRRPSKPTPRPVTTASEQPAPTPQEPISVAPQENTGGQGNNPQDDQNIDMNMIDFTNCPPSQVAVIDMYCF